MFSFQTQGDKDWGGGSHILVCEGGGGALNFIGAGKDRPTTFRLSFSEKDLARRRKGITNGPGQEKLGKKGNPGRSCCWRDCSPVVKGMLRI